MNVKLVCQHHTTLIYVLRTHQLKAQAHMMNLGSIKKSQHENYRIMKLR